MAFHDDLARVAADPEMFRLAVRRAGSPRGWLRTPGRRRSAPSPSGRRPRSSRTCPASRPVADP